MRARNGSVEHITYIYLFDPSRLPHTDQLDVIAMIRYTLALHCPINEVPVEEDLDLRDRICICFRMIRQLHYSYYMGDRITELQMYWPDTLRWLTYLHKNAASSRPGNTYGFVAGLPAVLHSGHLPTFLRSSYTPEENSLLELACTLWSYPTLPEAPSEEVAEVVSKIGMWTDSLQNGLVSLFGNPEDVVALAFTRLRHSLKIRPFQCDPVSAHTRTIASLLRADSCGIRQALVNAGVVRRIIKLMLKLVEAGDDWMKTCTCPLSTCLLVLIEVHCPTRRHFMHLANSALHHHMLEPLLRSGRIYSKLRLGAARTLQTFITRYISMFMCFKLYANRCLLAMDALDGSLHIERELKDAPREFKDTWTILTSYVLEANILRKLNAMGLLNQKVWCDEVSWIVFLFFSLC